VNHRHLDLPPGTAVTDLPAAALVDILDRGDLDDWAPVAAAVAADPLGPFADRVAALVDAFPMDGTSALWRAFLDRCRARAAAAPPVAAPARPLDDLRRRRGLTQAELGRRLGISQSDLSKLERRADLRVSTLAAYAHALGGRLRLLVELPDGEVEVRLRPGNPGRAR
jgi:DNA-binding Xre family transcriptional regulator